MSQKADSSFAVLGGHAQGQKRLASQLAVRLLSGLVQASCAPSCLSFLVCKMGVGAPNAPTS